MITSQLLSNLLINPVFELLSNPAFSLKNGIALFLPENEIRIVFIHVFKELQ